MVRMIKHFPYEKIISHMISVILYVFFLFLIYKLCSVYMSFSSSLQYSFLCAQKKIKFLSLLTIRGKKFPPSQQHV